MKGKTIPYEPCNSLDANVDMFVAHSISPSALPGGEVPVDMDVTPPFSTIPLFKLPYLELPMPGGSHLRLFRDTVVCQGDGPSVSIVENAHVEFAVVPDALFAPGQVGVHGGFTAADHVLTAGL